MRDAETRKGKKKWLIDKASSSPRQGDVLEDLCSEGDDDDDVSAMQKGKLPLSLARQWHANII